MGGGQQVNEGSGLMVGWGGSRWMYMGGQLVDEGLGLMVGWGGQQVDEGSGLMVGGGGAAGGCIWGGGVF